jgi:hypothetical protein
VWLPRDPDSDDWQDRLLDVLDRLQARTPEVAQ